MDMTTYPTPDPIKARVELALGSVQITAGPTGETVIGVEPTDPASERDRRAAQATRVTCTDGQLDVVGPRGNGLGLGRRPGSVQVSIALPTGSSLRANVAAGAVQADVALGEVSARVSAGDITVLDASTADLKSGFGDVTARNVGGDMRCSSGSGEIRVDRIDGQALLKNANGDTWIGEGGSTMRVKSANGDIRVDRACRDLVASTANGNVRVGSIERGSIVLRTSAGNIDLGIPPGVSARVDLRTGFGTVRNNLDVTDVPDAGDRTVEVDAQTSYGDVTLTRALLTS
jgi:DUF4097 and DUF4098 domain-containing protein YvlB